MEKKKKKKKKKRHQRIFRGPKKLSLIMGPTLLPCKVKDQRFTSHAGKISNINGMPLQPIMKTSFRVKWSLKYHWQYDNTGRIKMTLT